MSTIRFLVLTLVVGSMGTASVAAAELQRKTLNAWENVSMTEVRIEAEIESKDGFLAQDFFSAEELRECRQTIESGGVCLSKRQTAEPSGREITIPSGMVHHWLGSALVPDVSLDELLAWLQDYSKHQDRFSDVEASRLLSREGNVFEIFLRLKQDSIVTVQFNTEHVVEFTASIPRESLENTLLSIRKGSATTLSSDRESPTPPGRETQPTAPSS